MFFLRFAKISLLRTNYHTFMYFDVYMLAYFRFIITSTDHSFALTDIQKRNNAYHCTVTCHSTDCQDYCDVYKF